MGSIPILHINVNITIDTMLKFDAHVNIDAQCEPLDVQKSHNTSDEIKLRNDDVLVQLRNELPNATSYHHRKQLLFWYFGKTFREQSVHKNSQLQV